MACAGKAYLAPLALARARCHRRPLPRLSRAILCSFPGGANHAGQHRMPAMAAVSASMMRSSVSDLSSAASGWDTTGTVARASHAQRSGQWHEARRPPFAGTRHRASRVSTERIFTVIVAMLLRVFQARLALANSPSGRSPVSQDAASAYEIALGIASGSLLSDAVTQVT